MRGHKVPFFVIFEVLLIFRNLDYEKNIINSDYYNSSYYNINNICNSGETKITDPTAVEMMTDVFEGNHTTIKVKDKMDAVMNAYKVEITERNYEKCGSALVSMRKATGVTEMDIIEHMLEANTGNNGVSFSDQAALSATMLEK